MRAFTLDLRDLTFIDVVGLGALQDAQGVAASVGAAFMLRSVSDFTLKVIVLTGHHELEMVIEQIAVPSP